MTTQIAPAPSKPIQEQYGDAMLTALHAFCEADLDPVDQLEASHFSHVDESGLRRALAETMYGARWIYKLGLALLVRDDKQLAHVRAQVIDYGSVCEGLLSSMIHHALQGGHTAGEKHKFSNTAKLTNPIKWSTGNKLPQLKNRSFHWLIEVAEDEKIVLPANAKRLHELRKNRNVVHVRARTYKAYLGTSKKFYRVLSDTLDQTKAWKSLHK
jgi:hypothetical protein